MGISVKRKRQPQQLSVNSDLPFEGGAWTSVEVHDDFLVGSTEGGFMGLEEFKPLVSAQPLQGSLAGKKRPTGSLSQEENPVQADSKNHKQGARALQQAPSLRGRKRRKTDDPGCQTAVASKPTVGEQAVAGGLPEQELELVGSLAEHTDVTAWDGLGLDPRLLQCLTVLGFCTPTPIQQDCLPSAIRDRRDVIGAAQTGSGKTLAFGLPILQQLTAQAAAAGQSESADELQQLKALIFAPTRELALQVCEHLQPFGRACGLRVVPVVGGLAPAKQQRLLGKRPAVVVATPGRLWELMRSGEPHLSDLSGLAFLVLDEADRMVQAGHFQELNNILEQIPGLQPAAAQPQSAPTGGRHKQGSKPKPKADAAQAADSPAQSSIQTFVFSATLTLPHSLRRRLRKGGGGASGSSTLESLMDKIAFRGQPKVVDLTSERKLADQVEEAQIQCTDEHRDELLYYLIARHPGRTLVFANAISTVRRLAAVMSHLKVPCGALHAGMQQRQRLSALDRLRTNSDAVMIATDVAARGIDVQGISCVVHYQLPASGDMYVHRCGRTARAGNAGVAVALVTPQEAPRFAALLQALGRSTPPDMPVDSGMLPGVRERMRLAMRIDKLVRSGRKARAEDQWHANAARELDLGGSDDELPQEHTGSRQRSASAVEAAALQQALGQLLAEPLQPRFSRRYFTGHPAAAVAQSQATARAVASTASATDDEHQAASQYAGAVTDAIALAKEMAASRKAAAQGAAKKVRHKGLHASIRQIPGKKRRRGMVVIPAAIGRAATGLDALQLLRAQRGAL